MRSLEVPVRLDARARPAISAARRVDVLRVREDAGAVRRHVGDAARRADRQVARCSGTCTLPTASAPPTLNAVSKLPVLTAHRAGALPAVSWSRIRFQRLPCPGSAGCSAHFTLSCAAAWIALVLLRRDDAEEVVAARTTCAPAMCLIELSSTESDLRRRAVAVGALAARPHDAAVQHARDPDVVDVGVLAGDLGRDVDPRRAACRRACTRSPAFPASRDRLAGVVALPAAEKPVILTLNSLSPISAP